jgi:GTP-binding protein
MKKYAIQYLVSAVHPEQWPQGDRPEVVLVGRSNAGKSSLINALWGQPVAFVSATPGKTVVLNFYDVGRRYRVVDSPGYGYARKAADVEAGLRGIEFYLANRPTLKGLLMVADIRRELEPEEEWILEFCKKNKVPAAVVLNKSDRLNQKERAAQNKKWSRARVPVFPVSAQEKTGVEELEKWMFESWIAAPSPGAGT